MDGTGTTMRFTLASQPAAAVHAGVEGPLGSIRDMTVADLAEEEPVRVMGPSKRDRLTRLLLAARQFQQR